MFGSHKCTKVSFKISTPISQNWLSDLTRRVFYISVYLEIATINCSHLKYQVGHSDLETATLFSQECTVKIKRFILYFSILILQITMDKWNFLFQIPRKMEIKSFITSQITWKGFGALLHFISGWCMKLTVHFDTSLSFQQHNEEGICWKTSLLSFGT